MMLKKYFFILPLFNQKNLIEIKNLFSKSVNCS